MMPVLRHKTQGNDLVVLVSFSEHPNKTPFIVECKVVRIVHLSSPEGLLHQGMLPEGNLRQGLHDPA